MASTQTHAAIHTALNEFTSGRYLQATKSLKDIHFSTFDLLEWVRDNNVSVFEFVWEQCRETSAQTDTHSAQCLEGFEKLLTKIRSHNCQHDANIRRQSLVLECAVLYNVLLLHTLRLLVSSSTLLDIPLDAYSSHLEITLQRIVDRNKQTGSDAAVDGLDPGCETKSKTDFPWFYLQPTLLLCLCVASASGNRELVDFCKKFLMVRSEEFTEWGFRFASPAIIGSNDNDKSPHLKMKEMVLVLKFFDSTISTSQIDNKAESLIKHTCWKPYIDYARAYSFYMNTEFQAATEVFPSTHKEKTHNDTLQAFVLNLQGCCHFKLGHSWNAIQMFQAALKLDFSFLIPLHNVVVVYRQQHHVSAELETMKYLLTALKGEKNASKNTIHQVGLNNGIKITRHRSQPHLYLPHVMYIMSQRCFQENRFSEAAEYYLDLLTDLMDTSFLQPTETSTVFTPLPSVTEIHLEAAFCMLEAEKYNECLAICEWLLSCVNNSSSELPSEVLEESYSMDMLSDEELLFPDSPKTSKKRNLSEVGLANSPSGNASHDVQNPPLMASTMLYALLYKADSLVQLNQLEKALHCLQLATNAIREDPGLLTKFIPVVQSLCKRQKGEGGIPAPPPVNTANNKSHPIGLISSVYNNTGVVLQCRDQFKDALHCFRLGLQIVPNDLLLCFNCVLTLIRLKHLQDASSLWADYRGFDIQKNNIQLCQEVNRKKTQLESEQNESRTSKSAPKSTDKPSSCTLLQLDICILQSVMRLRRS